MSLEGWGRIQCEPSNTNVVATTLLPEGPPNCNLPINVVGQGYPRHFLNPAYIQWFDKVTFASIELFSELARLAIVRGPHYSNVDLSHSTRLPHY